VEEREVVAVAPLENFGLVDAEEVSIDMLTKDASLAGGRCSRYGWVAPITWA